MTAKKKTRRAPPNTGNSLNKPSSGSAQEARPTVMLLKGQLDIREASNLKTKLGRLLKKNQGVVLDASKVEKVDTSVMQLLTAFYRSATAKGMEVRWKNPNSRLISAAQTLGLSGPLGIENTAQRKPD